eukprot:103769-Chlamydomonas_euryale.AAC.1
MATWAGRCRRGQQRRRRLTQPKQARGQLLDEPAEVRRRGIHKVLDRGDGARVGALREAGLAQQRRQAPHQRRRQ